MKNINIIAAFAKNRALGKNNKLIWHLSEDMKRFKRLTIGNTVLMGRLTFESLQCHALPDRRNIVLSTGSDLYIENVEWVHSLEESLKIIDNAGMTFIIGGASIYKQYIPYADTMFLTMIHHEFDADSFFPEFNEKEWNIQEREDFNDDEQSQWPYSFVTFKRISGSI